MAITRALSGLGSTQSNKRENSKQTARAVVNGMKDGLEFETLYLNELRNFKDTGKEVEHGDLMGALILKETLGRLYAGEIHFVGTSRLDDDDVTIEDLKIRQN
jgi:hypothetical protein